MQEQSHSVVCACVRLCRLAPVRRQHGVLHVLVAGAVVAQLVAQYLRHDAEQAPRHVCVVAAVEHGEHRLVLRLELQQLQCRYAQPAR